MSTLTFPRRSSQRMDVDTAMAALVMTFISRVFFSFTVLTRPYPWPVPCQEELNNFVQLGARRHVRGCRFSDFQQKGCRYGFGDGVACDSEGLWPVAWLLGFAASGHGRRHRNNPECTLKLKFSAEDPEPYSSGFFQPARSARVCVYVFAVCMTRSLWSTFSLSRTLSRTLSRSLSLSLSLSPAP